MSEVSVKSQVAPAFWHIFNSKKPWIILTGGRGSTKTSFCALKIVLHCLQEPLCSAIVMRRYQNTLRNSVFKEIKRACIRLGLQENVHYTSNVSPMQITFNNGNRVYFAGSDDYEKLKGFIDETRPIKIVWFEEASEYASEDDFDQIIATFSRGNNDWFITLISYNPPKNKYNFINVWHDKMAKQPNVITSHTSYLTVPSEWLGLKFIEQAEALKNADEKRYRWIYLGEVTGIEGLIYNPDMFEYVDEDYIEKNKIKILYIDFATDSGHQTSATTCGAFGYGSDGYWYRLDTYYYSPNEKSVKKAPSELSKDLYNFKQEVCKKYASSCDMETIDSAEGALRNQYFKDYGIRLHPVNKGTNKEELIEYSQDFIAQHKFRVLNNGNNSIFKVEIENYMWDEKSIENGKPEPCKDEKRFSGNATYYNTYTNDYAYTYADHTCDSFQYWIKDNLSKLNLKF